MRNVVLLELAKRWNTEAVPPKAQDGAPEAHLGNAVDAAVRETKRECADTLIMLTQILGD